MNKTGARIGAVVATLMAVAFIGAALQFASVQNVWIDETTQLSGATLPLGRLLAWLAGGVDPAIAVPPDRAPPLSYLLDAACARTLCGTPFHFRLLHLAVTFAGALLLLMTLARRYGSVALVMGAAVLFLSPKLVEYAVEIRPYPLFIALTCVQIVLLDALMVPGRLRPAPLLLFAGVGLLAIYTHFFGLVSTMALFGGLFAARARDRREVLAIGGAAVAVLVLSAGLKPFISGATAISQAPLPAADANAAGQFALKLIGQPAMLLWAPAALLFFATLAAVLAAAVVRVAVETARDGWRARGSTALALVVGLGLGLGVPLAAAAIPHGFDPLKPTYSLWVLPVLALLATVACAPAPAGAPAIVGRVLVPLARSAAAVFIVAALVIQSIFLAHDRWFVHGPERAIAAAAGPRAAGVAIVYRGDWGYGYFPTLWRYGGQMRQWVLLPDDTLHRLTRARVDLRAAPADPFAGDRRLVAVDIVQRRYLDLRPLLSGARAKVLYPPMVPPAGFTIVAQWTMPGLYWTGVTVFERSGR